MIKILLAAAALALTVTGADATELPACDNPGVVKIVSGIINNYNPLMFAHDTSSPPPRDKRWCSAVKTISFVDVRNTKPAEGRRYIYTIEYTDEAAGRYWVEVKPGFRHCVFVSEKSSANERAALEIAQFYGSDVCGVLASPEPMGSAKQTPSANPCGTSSISWTLDANKNEVYTCDNGKTWWPNDEETDEK
jgi:hypothetical protein